MFNQNHGLLPHSWPDSPQNSGLFERSDRRCRLDGLMGTAFVSLVVLAPNALSPTYSLIKLFSITKMIRARFESTKCSPRYVFFRHFMLLKRQFGLPEQMNQNESK